MMVEDVKTKVESNNFYANEEKAKFYVWKLQSIALISKKTAYKSTTFPFLLPTIYICLYKCMTYKYKTFRL